MFLLHVDMNGEKGLLQETAWGVCYRGDATVHRLQTLNLHWPPLLVGYCPDQNARQTCGGGTRSVKVVIEPRMKEQQNPEVKWEQLAGFSLEEGRQLVSGSSQCCKMCSKLNCETTNWTEICLRNSCSQCKQALRQPGSLFQCYAVLNPFHTSEAEDLVLPRILFL